MSVRRRPTFSQGRGAVLVLMIPLLFAFFALAALVIDLGILRTTQQRMTAACETSALEALRWRDETPAQAVPDLVPPLPAIRDQQRRQAASAIVDNTFSNPPADDLTSTDPAATNVAPFDAGPLFQSEQQSAFRVTMLPQAGGYRPQLQMNLTNEFSGDVVAARYTPLVSHADEEQVDGIATPYLRADFAVDPSADASPDAAAALIRLRRSRETAIEGQTSVGPALPLLFGRGTLIRANETPNAYSIRRDGISVRAAAIAQALPAVAVSAALDPVTTPASTTVTVQGVQPVALSVTFWNTLTAVAADGTPTPVAVSMGTQGTLSSGGASVGYLWHAPPMTAAGFTAIGIPTIATDPGNPIPAPAQTGDPVLTAAVQGFFPIYELISDGLPTPTLTERIIGFGYARWDPKASTITKLSQVGYDPTAKTYTAVKGYVAPASATTNLSAAWPGMGLLLPYEQQQILLANGQTNPDPALTLAAPAVATIDPVLAPALVRAVGD